MFKNNVNIKSIKLILSSEGRKHILHFVQQWCRWCNRCPTEKLKWNPVSLHFILKLKAALLLCFSNAGPCCEAILQCLYITLPNCVLAKWHVSKEQLSNAICKLCSHYLDNYWMHLLLPDIESRPAESWFQHL